VLPENAPLWAALLVVFVTQLITLWQVHVANRARKDTVQTAEKARLAAQEAARRTENGLRVRWATEMAFSEEPKRAAAGMELLIALERNEDLEPVDREMARTSYRTAIAPLEEEWEARKEAGEEVSAALDPEEAEEA
jgi:hypothetical protein